MEKKLEEDINELEKKKKVLENDEHTLDKVWYIFIYLMSEGEGWECELQKWNFIKYFF